MTLNQQLTRRYLRHMVAHPAGRAHMLNSCADAESNGESQIFERALAHVDDPELSRLVRRHQADEVRHAELFRERLSATGIEPGPVPEELKLLERVDRMLGGMLTRPIVDRRGVMDAYLLLLVLEERAVTQFPIFEEAFRAVDPATAEVFAEVARDEARHLLYCQAISRRYAPDLGTLDETVARIRAVEARAFADNSRANMRYVLEHGYFAAGPVETLAWRGLTAISPWFNPAQPTRFSDEAQRSPVAADPVLAV